MLYKKNSSKTLDDGLFKNPTSEYRGTPFWAWNCDLDKDELLWQIEQLKKMGFGGFHMHSRSGMATPYLSDEFMDLVKACVSKAEKEEMLAYLYDEDRWPSGSAGGIVTKDRRYAQRNLKITLTPIKDSVSYEEADATGKPYFLTAFNVVLNDKGELKGYKSSDETKDATGTRWYAYIVSTEKTGWYNNESYINTLSKEAVDKFIEVTHEAYKRELGDKFGKSVPSIFTDEPQFSSKGTLDFAQSTDDIILPWSMDFDKGFNDKYGYSIAERLPELFWELPDDKISVARYNYHDYVTCRFAEAFADNCGLWCEKNSISLTGHVLSEESLHSQTTAVGEAMRSYRHFGIPGIDILCDAREFSTAKQAQSTVHQFGKDGMLSELYGVTNWDFDFRGHKFQGDWQAALGVTVRVPHLSWVSMKGDAKRDYPASINYQSSWYKEYKYIEDHFARVNTAMTRGKALVKVAVIHPVETYWLHFGPKENTADIRKMLDKQFDNTLQWLLSGIIDFDYISESLFPEQVNTISDTLQVGEMTYSAIVISGCETLRSTTIEILEKYSRAGGKIIFMGEAPKMIDAVLSDRPAKLYNNSIRVPITKTALLKALESERCIDIRDANGERTEKLLYQLRLDNDCEWLFIAHREEEAESLNLARNHDRKIILWGEFTPYLYDTLSGNINKINYEIKNGKTIIYYSFYRNDSLLLRLVQPESTSYHVTAPEKHIIKIQRFYDKVSYSLSEQNVLLLDFAQYKINNDEYSDKEEIREINKRCRKKLGFINNLTQPWTIEKKEIVNSVTLKYEFESEIEVEGAYFATEDADICTVIFNGSKLNNNTDGYFTDKSISRIKLPVIKCGINTIEVIYPYGERNTLENSFILGDFNVRCEGTTKTIIAKTKKIGFGDITSQGLPFYGANITYKMDIEAPEDCDAIINAGTYIGAVIRVKLDDVDLGVIAFSPYEVTAKNISAGKHTLEVTLFGTRNNCFGTLHLTDTKLKWFGPTAWERCNKYYELANEYPGWSYEYTLKPMGILASPEIKYIR